MTAATKAERTTWNQVAWHPYANEFHLLEGADFKGLCEDIRVSGQIETIKFRMVKGAKQYLDGRNRWRACDWLGIEPRLERVFGLDTDKQVTAYIDSLNDKRRHDTPQTLQERRQERIGRVGQSRSEGKSIRAIAEQENVSVVQVQRDLEEVQVYPPGTPESEPANGTPPAPAEPAKIVGRDGKNYKPRKPRKKKDRLPGDDTDSEKAERDASRRNGKPSFKIKDVEDSFAALVRAISRAEDAWGKSKHLDDCRAGVRASYEHWILCKGSTR